MSLERKQGQVDDLTRYLKHVEAAHIVAQHEAKKQIRQALNTDPNLDPNHYPNPHPNPNPNEGKKVLQPMMPRRKQNKLNTTGRWL